MDANAFDEQMMRRTLELALTAEGRTAPNPMVGAVITDSVGLLLAEGYHAQAGQPHAEIVALAQIGGRAPGATLYVNLEPCSHYGRTPPCAGSVIESGIKRVVIGMQDPNPQVCGQGIARLRAAGIAVEISSIENECRELNRAFVKRMLSGLPWVSLKLASTLDGRIADRQGRSRWITGAEARHFVHQLRNTYDCVLIGGRTAATDDPELSVRDIADSRDPVRAVVDRHLEVLPQARLCLHKADSKSWTAIFTTGEKIETAPPYPEQVTLVSIGDPGCGSSFLRQSLSWLAGKGVLSVLCEGGGRLAASLLAEGLVDEIFWFVAPKLFVDSLAVPALAGKQAVEIESCLNIENLSFHQLGSDMLVQGRLKGRLHK
jgi:diaminohydroxyphosphoribosylaminopyrimidine deaminase / 5-amino-6-(5-phosphoribosylamino)uracil reductase